jgi:hypothetical protein
MVETLTQELYMSFRKMCLEFKLRFYTHHTYDPLMVAWYQHHCRYYEGEHNA